MSTTSMPAASLEGIRVLDLSRLLPGPFLTMVLADMGADVIKIEAPNVGDYLRSIPPAKGGMSGRFLAVNRDKRSLVLDLKTDAGREALLRMVESADVVARVAGPTGDRAFPRTDARVAPGLDIRGASR